MKVTSASPNGVITLESVVGRKFLIASYPNNFPSSPMAFLKIGVGVNSDLKMDNQCFMRGCGGTCT